MAVFAACSLFRAARALRLGVPFLYAAAAAFLLPGWSARHRALAVGIFFVLTAVCLLSWVVTLIRRILERRAEKELEAWEAEAALEELKRRQGIA